MSDLLSSFRSLITDWVATYKDHCVCQIDYNKSQCYHAPEDINIFRFRLIGYLLEQFDREHPELRSYPWYQESVQIFTTLDPSGPRDCMAVMNSIINNLQ